MYPGNKHIRCIIYCIINDKNFLKISYLDIPQYLSFNSDFLSINNDLQLSRA